MPNILHEILVLNLKIGFEDWIHKWVQNKWRGSSGQPVKNVKLIQYISALIADRYDRGQNVHLQYVKGHSGDVGNDGADALAVAGCALPILSERDWSAAQRALENQVSNTVEQDNDDLMDGINWEVCGFRSLDAFGTDIYCRNMKEMTKTCGLMRYLSWAKGRPLTHL